MSRIVLAASLVVAVASAVSLGAQQGRPDLSGRWTLAPDLSTPAGTHAFGTTLVVSQSADTVTLEQEVVNIQFAAGATAGAFRPTSRSETGGTMRADYVADGIDHDVPIQTTTPAVPANARVVSTMSIQAKSYRAVWMGKQLIIMTRDSLAFTRANSEPITIRRMIRQALTLNADGSLTGDSLILADPVPSSYFFNAGPEQPAPVPVRSVYRRAQ
jgi:hypothetical protein